MPHLATVGFVSVALPLPTKMAAHNSAACGFRVLLLLLLSTATLSASGSSLCTMPSPAPKHQPGGEDALPLLGSLELNAGYFFGGEDLQFTKDEGNETSYSYVTRSFSLLLLHAYRTSDTAVFHVAAILTLSGGRDKESHYMGSRRRRRRHRYVGSHSVTFSVEGYYTNGTTSAELCVAGTGSYSDENGSTKRLRGVDLYLRVPNPSSITDPFITGGVRGTGFKTISLVAYVEDDSDTYNYGAKSASCSAPPPSSAAAARGALQALGPSFSCAHLKERLATSYKLRDGDGAHAPVSSPERRLHISEVQCTADGSVRAYAAFSNDTQSWRRLQPRSPFVAKDEAVVAEGQWDSARSMLCLRACRVVSSGASMEVNKECDMGMSFWFPGVWTIRDRSAVAGMLWNSSKAAGGSGVSGVISASSIDVSIHRGNFSDVKYDYDYTMVEEAKKHYLQDRVLSKPKTKVKGPFIAPNYTDHDFEFHFYETKSMMLLSGDAYPVTIGSAMVYGDQLAAADSFSRNAVVDMNSQELLNVSYDIRERVPPTGWVRPKNRSYGVTLEERRMTAEGVFDPKTGILCMIACREYNSSTTDCQILITVYLASLDGKAHGHGRGAISSLRDKATDPLFFEKVDIRLFGMYSGQISESISRMDLESILLVISTTLPCVFTVLQIFHAKRRPEAAAATSVAMLVVLALGYVAPLVVSSEALFLSRRRQYVPLPFQSYVPYELSQAMLRAPTLIALLLQLRLVQLALSARKADADRNKAEASSSVAERRALWLCAPLYLIGGALTIIVHVVDALRAAREESLTVRVGPEPATLWEDLVSSAGLAQDAFLLPQVVMNALSPGGASSRVRALSPWFYIGGTVVRAMPHVYDVIRAQGYVPSSKPSYVYASPRYDRYGVAWDVVVPSAAALLAVLLFLQQRVGLAPPPLFRSPRRLGEYQMVSPL